MFVFGVGCCEFGLCVWVLFWTWFYVCAVVHVGVLQFDCVLGCFARLRDSCENCSIVCMFDVVLCCLT